MKKLFRAVFDASSKWMEITIVIIQQQLRLLWIHRTKRFATKVPACSSIV